MTNQELFNEFTGIYFMNSGLDQHIALKNFKKKYKTSEFYKNTHYSIYKTFNIFCKSQYNNAIKTLTSLLNPSELAEKANIFIDDLDMDKINQLLEKITHELDITTLMKDKESLKEAITKLQA